MLPLPALHTARTVIRLPTDADVPLLQHYRVDNREHFAPWEPLREESWYDADACWRFVATALTDAREDRAYPLLVLDPEQHEILASITLANVTRGIFQACHAGYGTAARWQGQGIMFEALQAVLELAFGPLGLHRVMANYQPYNERSAALLERLGFEKEGLARAYLKINGRWRDHVLTACINPHG
ncbi:MAG TPA: GNAT family N-acetyltransferase [Rhodanobacteraceae bacterium]